MKNLLLLLFGFLTFGQNFNTTDFDSNSNIDSVAVSGHEDHSELIFTLSVKDRVHLANIMRNIRKMRSVHRISREGR